MGAPPSVCEILGFPFRRGGPGSGCITGRLILSVAMNPSASLPPAAVRPRPSWTPSLMLSAVSRLPPPGSVDVGAPDCERLRWLESCWESCRTVAQTFYESRLDTILIRRGGPRATVSYRGPPSATACPSGVISCLTKSSAAIRDSRRTCSNARFFLFIRLRIRWLQVRLLPGAPF